MSLLLAGVTPPTFAPSDDPAPIVAPAPTAAPPFQPWTYDQGEVPTIATAGDDWTPQVPAPPSPLPAQPWNFAHDEIVSGAFGSDDGLTVPAVPLVTWTAMPAIDQDEIMSVGFDDGTAVVLVAEPPRAIAVLTIFDPAEVITPAATIVDDDAFTAGPSATAPAYPLAIFAPDEVPSGAFGADDGTTPAAPPLPAWTFLPVFDQAEVTAIAHDDDAQRLDPTPLAAWVTPAAFANDEMVSVGRDDDQAWYRTDWTPTVTITLNPALEQHEIVSVGFDDDQAWWRTEWTPTPAATLTFHEQNDRPATVAPADDWTALAGWPLPAWAAMPVHDQSEVSSVAHDDDAILLGSTPAIPWAPFYPWTSEQNQIVNVGSDDSEAWYRTDWRASETATIALGDSSELPTAAHADDYPWVELAARWITYATLEPWLYEQNEITATVGNDTTDPFRYVWDRPAWAVIDEKFYAQHAEFIIGVDPDDLHYWETFQAWPQLHAPFYPWEFDAGGVPPQPVPPAPIPPNPQGGFFGGGGGYQEPECPPDDPDCKPAPKPRSRQVRPIDRLRKLLALTRSDNDHEAQSAATEVSRMLRDGLLDEIAAAPEPSRWQPFAAVVSAVLAVLRAPVAVVLAPLLFLRKGRADKALPVWVSERARIVGGDVKVLGTGKPPEPRKKD